MSSNTQKRYMKLWKLAVAFKIIVHSPGQVAQLAEVLSHAPKGCWFNPQSEHIPKLWIWSPVGVHTNQCFSHRCLSVCLSVSLPPPCSVSKINECILGWGLKISKIKSLYIISTNWENWNVSLYWIIRDRGIF